MSQSNNNTVESLGVRMLAAVNSGYTFLENKKREVANQIENYVIDNYHMTIEDVEVSHFNNTTSVTIATESGFDGKDFVIEENNYTENGIDSVISANGSVLVLSLIIDDVRIPVAEKNIF